MATLLVGGYVWTSNGMSEGVIFLLLGAGLTFGLRIMEQVIFADNIYKGRYGHIHY